MGRKLTSKRYLIAGGVALGSSILVLALFAAFRPKYAGPHEGYPWEMRPDVLRAEFDAGSSSYTVTWWTRRRDDRLRIECDGRLLADQQGVVLNYQVDGLGLRAQGEGCAGPIYIGMHPIKTPPPPPPQPALAEDGYLWNDGALGWVERPAELSPPRLISAQYGPALATIHVAAGHVTGVTLTCDGEPKIADRPGRLLAGEAISMTLRFKETSECSGDLDLYLSGWSPEPMTRLSYRNGRPAPGAAALPYR